jgi:hypothetical protein
LKLIDLEVFGMPSVVFILLLALVIFGPRKLREITSNVLPTEQPWEKLMSLMAKFMSPGNQGLASISASGAEPPKPAIAQTEPSSSLVKSMGSE